VTEAISPAEIRRASRVSPDIAYGPDLAQALDLFTPKNRPPDGLVLFMHGGSWRRGDKTAGRLVGHALAASGYALASIGYRKLPETEIPGQAADIATAAAFLLAGAGGRLHPASRFALAGHSAGGHLAALVATDPAYLAASGVAAGALAAVITLDGVFDVATMVAKFPRAAPPEVFGTSPEGWQAVAPIAHLPAMTADPLFGIMHEDTNRRFIEQATLFCDALRLAGKRWIRAVAPGMDHGDIMRHYADTGQPMLTFTQACLRLAF